jgi:hypothetical protein
VNSVEQAHDRYKVKPHTPAHASVEEPLFVSLHILHVHSCGTPDDLFDYPKISLGGKVAVSIVSDYGPRQRQTYFPSSLCVQTGSWVHPASCTMGTGGPFPVAKARPGRDADHSPHLVTSSRMSRSYTSPPKRLHDV